MNNVYNSTLFLTNAFLLGNKFLGFMVLPVKTISRLVNIGRIGTIRMQADAYQLKRVMVKGNLRTDRGDHATYTFNEEQVKNSRHTATGYWLFNDAKYRFETINRDADSGAFK